MNNSEITLDRDRDSVWLLLILRCSSPISSHSCRPAPSSPLSSPRMTPFKSGANWWARRTRPKRRKRFRTRFGRCLAKVTAWSSLLVSFLDNTRNAVHGSDSVMSSQREISFFFPQMILTGDTASSEYLEQHVMPTLNASLTQLAKEKPERPLLWLATYLEKNNPNKPDVEFVWNAIYIYSIFPINFNFITTAPSLIMQVQSWQPPTWIR